MNLDTPIQTTSSQQNTSNQKRGVPEFFKAIRTTEVRPILIPMPLSVVSPLHSAMLHQHLGVTTPVPLNLKGTSKIGDTIMHKATYCGSASVETVKYL
jgi:hypothetical protein